MHVLMLLQSCAYMLHIRVHVHVTETVKWSFEKMKKEAKLARISQ